MQSTHYIIYLFILSTNVVTLQKILQKLNATKLGNSPNRTNHWPIRVADLSSGSLWACLLFAHHHMFPQIWTEIKKKMDEKMDIYRLDGPAALAPKRLLCVSPSHS